MALYNNFDTVAGPPEGISKLNAAFDETKGIGHDHKGPGNGGPIDAEDIVVEPSGNLDSEDAQAAFYELQSDIDSLNSRVGANPSFRNKLRNSSFMLWSRGTTFNYSTAFSHTADGWMVGTTGGSGTLSRVLATGLDYTPSQFYVNWIHNSGSATSAYFLQRMEFSKTLSGKNATIKIKARLNSGNNSFRFDLAQNFGSGGSTTVAISGGNIVFSSGIQEKTVTITIPTINGKTVGINDYFVMSLQSNNPTQAHNLDIFQFQIEEGDISTPFEITDTQTEQLRCYRYTEPISGICIPVSMLGNNNPSYEFKVQKRNSSYTFINVAPAAGSGLGLAIVDSNSCYQSVANSQPAAFSAIIDNEL